MEINNNKKIKQNDQSKYNYSTDENNDNKKNGKSNEENLIC